MERQSKKQLEAFVKNVDEYPLKSDIDGVLEYGFDVICEELMTPEFELLTIREYQD
ncbi:hypothetical protein [Pseudoalteromonas sp. HM-SA03]|uniref:hypothetical protein n=1 Tax=Pseudoalteromonas sp. HM-SA03 TaxID=2029678 RepID=UPI0015960A9F|nr:hypothetical protein [Pseudoalteromonas sp. HM-SA03]